MRRTVYNTCRVVHSLSPATRANGTAAGTGVDRRTSSGGSTNEWYDSATIVIQTGTITDGTHTVTIQESDDNSGWSNVAAADLQGAAPTITASDDDKTYEVGYLGRKNFVRAQVVTSGATTGGVVGSVVVLGDPRRAPVVRP